MKNTFKTKWFVYLAELEEDISLEGKERKPAFRRPPPVQGFYTNNSGENFYLNCKKEADPFFLPFKKLILIKNHMIDS